MTTTPEHHPEAAACPACGYAGLILIHTAPATPAAYACVLPDCGYIHPLDAKPADRRARPPRTPDLH